MCLYCALFIVFRQMRRGPAQGNRGGKGGYSKAAADAAHEEVRAATEEDGPEQCVEGEEGGAVR